MWSQIGLIIRRHSRRTPRCNRLHKHELRHDGGEAQSAFKAASRALLGPCMALLDVSCKTGAFARRLSDVLPSSGARTLLDPSPEMLERCTDIDALRVRGRLETSTPLLKVAMIARNGRSIVFKTNSLRAAAFGFQRHVRLLPPSAQQRCCKMYEWQESQAALRRSYSNGCLLWADGVEKLDPPTAPSVRL